MPKNMHKETNGHALHFTVLITVSSMYKSSYTCSDDRYTVHQPHIPQNLITPET